MTKTALIVGNGKSTKLLYDYGFHNIPENIDVYCTSLAFRFCDDLNYNPQYYVFADRKCVKFQKKNLKEKIENYKGTREWYLCCDLEHFTFFDSKKVINIKHNATGVAALEIAINKNIYDKILMIGLDHNYTWINKHVKKINYENCVEYIEDVEEHPSYFYNYYLRKGDIVSWQFQLENGVEHKIHCKQTQRLVDSAKSKNIDIIDFSESLLKCKKSKDLKAYFV